MEETKMLKSGLFAGLVLLAGALPAADHVITVASGTVTNDVVDTDDRVVLIGNGGTLVLRDGNRFGGGFVVSNGFLVADYAASGLKDTHLELVGTANSRPAIFRPKGPAFTAPVAASGAGTISFGRYSGLGPYDQNLTVNLGGQGEVLQVGQPGFSPTEFDIGCSYSYDLTFENGLDLNNKGLHLKNPFSSKPTYFTGVVTNSAAGTQSGSFNYWDGTMVFVGKPGRVDFHYRKNQKWTPRCGNIVFSNCTVRTCNDVVAGESDVSTKLNITYGGGCDHHAESAWDFFAARPGSQMIVDGGSYDHNLILFLGDNTDMAANYALEGNLVITNNGTVKLGTFCLHRGSVNQYSGLFSVPNDGKHGDGNETRIGGWRASSVPVKGAGTSVYNLWGGTFDISSRIWCHLGSAETGTFNQYGGTASVWNPLLIGYWATGDGTLNVHGGTFTAGNAGDSYAMSAGHSGVGAVSVANGGTLRALGKEGVRIGWNAGARGRVSVDSLGTLEAKYVRGGSGTSAFAFNGGTLRATGTEHASDFLSSTLGAAEVTPAGGTFDTDGKGDFTFTKPLTAPTSADGTLAHRWVFGKGSLTDTVGGVTATTVGGVTASDGAVRLPGGAVGSGQVRLGANLIPTSSGWTMEVWFTLKSHKQFSRLMQSGLTKDGKSLFVCTRGNTNGGIWYFYFGGTENRKGKHVLQLGTPYHMSYTIEKLASGTWRGTVSFRDPETGALYDSVSQDAISGWTPAGLAQGADGGLWLGNGAWGDPDPDVEVREVRLTNAALAPAQLAASAASEHAVFRFHKAGANKLTLTGANTYACGTAVDAGTLALAADATLPATETLVAADATLDLSASGTPQALGDLAGAGTVKGGTVNVAGEIQPGGKNAVGTLTLDGTVLEGGTLVADIAADDTADRLVCTGALDLSGLSLEVAPVGELNRGTVYTLATAASVTGSFKSVAGVPGNWRVTVSATGVRLASSGLALMIR